MDKKLIVEVEEIIFESKKSEVESSSEDIQKNIEKLPEVLKVFQKIDIERLKIKDNEFTIVLNEKHLYLDNKFVNISADLDFAASDVILDVYSIYLKDIELALIGKSKVNISKKMLNFFGKYAYNNLEGELNVQLTEDVLDFYINSTTNIESLKFLKKFFRLDSVAEAWMYDNVTGKMKLNYLYGKIDLNKKLPIMDSLKGQVLIEDAKIRFHKDAKPVDTKKLTIDYKGDKLSFTLEKPTYNKSKIYGSKVYITDLTSLEKGVVVVDLKTKSILNNDILEILKAYKINLPLRQKSGKLDSRLILRIPYLASRKMDVDGTFNATNAVLRLNNFEFLAKKAKVVLKDNDVVIKDSHMIHNDMLDAYLDLTINTKNSTAYGSAKINSFDIGSKEDSVVNINDLKTDLKIDFKNNTEIDLKALQTKLDISKEKINVDIKDLSIVYPYSKLLETIDIKKGDLNVDIIDEDNISFKVNAKDLNFPFEKNGKAIKELSAKGNIKGKTTTIKTNDSDIEILFKDELNPLLKLNNIDLVLENNTKKSTKSKKFPNIDLELKNSIIKFDDEHNYKTSWANIHIKNSKISFEGEALDLDLPIARKGKQAKNLTIYGTYAKDILDIKTKDDKLKLKYELEKEKLTMKLNGYDVLYDTTIEEDKDSKIAYYISGINSNIIMNEKYIAKATTYDFIFENHKTDIDLKYKDTKFMYFKDSAGNILVNAKNMNDEFLNALMSKELIKDGNVNLTANGKDGVIIGSADLSNTKIIDLAILNNLLIFINTSPALINPFLAIPSVVGMATNGGFNLNGYRVNEGKIDFSYNFEKKYLNMNKIFTKGNGIDFDGHATIDFDSSKINSKLKLIFLKDYSKIVGAIPVINYVLLGDEKRVDTQVEIFGTLEEPKYKTELAKEGVTAPVNLLKRIITSPIKLIETLGGSIDKKDAKEEEEETKKDNK
ncbi:AsmA-like C-terminal domain-containing protein [Arcobacter sp. LA11]|uniref:YhdP family protein n=1 Tax=Arcobacter sp. LA11 TaxID=1898176 RepID=UPI001576A236|nr:AsmA-like C-terminal domain-containing protein [Arcobacter sp. LA11]